MLLMTISKTSTACIIPVARFLLLLLGLLQVPLVLAELSHEELRAIFMEINPNYPPDYIKPSPASGLYEVSYGAEILYITADGKHLLWQGDLINVSDRANLTDLARDQTRKAMLEEYGTDRLLVYPATGETRHAISVVTDVDCSYCRRFHQHIEEINEAGVEVRYLLFPRAGEGSSSYDKMVSVWCAEDRHAAMDSAKRLEPIPEATCANPVLEHIALVDRLSVQSTPSIFLADGTLVRGYRPPRELLPLLDQ